MVIRPQAQRVGHVPNKIDTNGFILSLGGVRAAAHGEVTAAAIVLSVLGRAGVHGAIPRGFLTAKVKPR